MDALRPLVRVAMPAVTAATTKLNSDGDAEMTVPQSVYEYIGPPKLVDWDHASLVKWRTAREQYEENIHERCEWKGEDYTAVVRSVRSAVDADMMMFLATYEIGTDKSQTTDEDIMVKVMERCETNNRDYLANPTALFTQNLKMHWMVKDVPDRVATCFRQIIADNGFHEHLGRGSPSDDDYVALMK
ncbi:unnamed protein product [Phytophthora fragariaefolia]|uniref:Unnamed protein product n=1 Tax=Phytophthora fragariaefolia TaxID=1490495 RepID=A0A9W6U6T4_9STRA|nr:unnamed protein product [Phytophthora fragariaefolia]